MAATPAAPAGDGQFHKSHEHHAAPVQHVKTRKLGFFEQLSFGWMNKVVVGARKDGHVDLDPLPLPSEQTAAVASPLFDAHWDAVAAEAKAAGKRPKLITALWRAFGRDLMKAGVFKLGWSICVIMGEFFPPWREPLAQALPPHTVFSGGGARAAALADYPPSCPRSGAPRARPRPLPDPQRLRARAPRVPSCAVPLSAPL